MIQTVALWKRDSFKLLLEVKLLSVQFDSDILLFVGIWMDKFFYYIFLFQKFETITFLNKSVR